MDRSSARVEVPWLEPADAYARLGDPEAFLLDGLGVHPEARYAYLALRPVAEVRVEGDQVIESSAAGTQTHRIEDALPVLRRVTQATRLAIDEPEGFTGGWVGVVAYEAGRLWEPTLPEPHPQSGPDLVLRLCTDTVVFDRVGGTVAVCARDLGDQAGPSPSQRAEALAARLSEPVPPDAADVDAPDPARTAPGQAPTVHGTWTTSLDEPAFMAAVESLRRRIRTGDLFQANLATRFEATVDGPGDGAPADAAWRLAWYRALQQYNPGPFMALASFGDAAVVSSSPELLFAVHDGIIRSRPIAGTRRRGRDAADDAAMAAELMSDAKEQAEHTMLLDLVRNDIARVAVAGSVRVPEMASIERYRRVMHLVSRVEGRVRPGTDWVDWMGALFPGGTITGAPKHRACVRIREHEPVARGAYTGSAGYLSWSHNAAWNILIRTAVLRGGRVAVHAGSGIVADSDPMREWKEAGHKAQALLDATAAPGTADAPPSPWHDAGTVTPHGAWAPSPPAGRAPAGTRVLVIDNYDSFVHNLADYCATLGADVRVVRNDEDWLGAVAAYDPTHIILSPGPGRPEDAGASMEMARSFVGRRPLLGVCLGHQCLAVAAGAPVVVAAETVHGRADEIRHDDSALLGPAGVTRAARYHSLVLDEAAWPTETRGTWRVTARLADGTVMAIEDAERRAFGLQFHPESVATRGGHEILLRFLHTA